MDPNEALRRLRELAQETLESERNTADSEQRDDVASELAETFQALDTWLSKQGFLPDAWKRG